MLKQQEKSQEGGFGSGSSQVGYQGGAASSQTVQRVPRPRAHIWLLCRPSTLRCFPAAGIFLVAAPAEAEPDSCQKRLGDRRVQAVLACRWERVNYALDLSASALCK